MVETGCWAGEMLQVGRAGSRGGSFWRQTQSWGLLGSTSLHGLCRDGQMAMTACLETHRAVLKCLIITRGCGNCRDIEFRKGIRQLSVGMIGDVTRGVWAFW